MYDFFIPQIDKKVKRFIGRVILGLAQGLYSIIREQAGKIGLYTYEIAADSKSMKVFLSSFDKNSLQEQIIDEHIAFKEFLIFLLNTTKTSGLYEFMKEIKPLNLDIAMVQEHLSDLNAMRLETIKCCSDMRIGEQNYTEVFYFFGCFDCVVCGPDMVVKIPAGA